MLKNLDALLDAACAVLDHANWYPDTDVATEEIIISTRYIRQLRQAYLNITETPEQGEEITQC